MWWVLRKLNGDFPRDPAVPPLGHTLEDGKRGANPCTPVFTEAPFTIARR